MRPRRRGRVKAGRLRRARASAGTWTGTFWTGYPSFRPVQPPVRLTVGYPRLLSALPIGQAAADHRVRPDVAFSARAQPIVSPLAFLGMLWRRGCSRLPIVAIAWPKCSPLRRTNAQQQVYSVGAREREGPQEDRRAGPPDEQPDQGSHRRAARGRHARCPRGDGREERASRPATPPRTEAGVRCAARRQRRRLPARIAIECKNRAVPSASRRSTPSSAI
jgi:hypothetical protein